MVQPASAEVATWITRPRWRGISMIAGSPLLNQRATWARDRWSSGSLSLWYGQVLAPVRPAITLESAPAKRLTIGCL